MRIAVVTDLHANREAVSAVLAHADAQGAQRHAFLGDFVGYGADPGWVIDLVAEHVGRGAVAVLGNHDEAVVKGPTPTMVPQARDMIEWTRARLSPRQLAWLQALPMVANDGDCLFVHANAYAPAAWGYVLGRLDAVRSLQATDRRYTFCGHVHEPKLYHLSATGKGGDFAPVPGVDIGLSPQRRWLAIAGSAGQPRDGNPAACYALFDTDRATLTFYRVPYDHEAAAARILSAGIAPALAQRLAQRLVDGE